MGAMMINPLNLIPGAFGLKGVAIAAAVGAAVGGFGSWKVTETFCDAAATKVELANVQSRLDATKLDLLASQAAASNSINAQGVIALRANASEEKVRDLQDALTKKPVACRALDADGLRRLLDISAR